MTVAHQFLATIVAAATVGLAVAASWSLVAGRRSGGRIDHRFAVDRLILIVIGLAGANGLLGLILVGVGSRPADPLHLLYGPAALATLPLAWWLGRRTRGADSTAGRGRADVWLMAGAIVLLGIELRLLMTG